MSLEIEYSTITITTLRALSSPIAQQHSLRAPCLNFRTLSKSISSRSDQENFLRDFFAIVETITAWYLMPLGVWEMIGEPPIRQSRFSFGQVFLTFANESFESPAKYTRGIVLSR